jgi:c-di-AMP phosphodiesterase-like protein
MKKQVLLRWLWTILEYLMVFPIVLIISGFTFNKNVQVLFTLLLPFHMLVSIIITMVLKRFRNLIITIITALYVAGVTALWIAAAPLGTIEEISVTIL